MPDTRKTWAQEVKSSQMRKVKKLTDAGKHKEASELFKRLFPGI